MATPRQRAAIERLQAVEPQLNAIVGERFREALQSGGGERGGECCALLPGARSPGRIATVTGTPAISLPLGCSAKGLPIGVQFAAALGRERQLLEIAFELERAMPWSYPAAPCGA